MKNLTDVSDYFDHQKNQVYDLAQADAREFRAQNPRASVRPVVAKTQRGVSIRWHWSYAGYNHDRMRPLRVNKNGKLHASDWQKIPPCERPQVATAEKRFRTMRLEAKRLAKAYGLIRRYESTMANL